MVTALSWTKEYVNPPDDLRIAAVLRCGAKDCSSVLKIPVGALGASPEWIVKLFARKGWRVDQHNQALCRCPNCIKTRRLLTEPVKVQIAELRQEGHTLRDIAEKVGRTHTTVQAALKRMGQTVKDDNNEERETMATVSKPALVEIGSIPPMVKTKIRQKLDACFDDQAGAYLSGQSDKSVAEELGIPMAQVYSLREMAYGPIKRDAEVDQLTAGIADLRKSMASLQSEIDRLDTKAGAILKRLGL